MITDDLNTGLGDLPGWSLADDSITKTFEFADFSAAMAFMARCVPEIDRMDHHPEWKNVYNRVEVWLTSHDAGGVTERDLRLAHLLDAAA